MAAPLESPDTLYAGELEIRLGDGLVLASGRVVRLSVREFDLIVAMARRSGAIATRAELYETVWGGELRAGDRSVDLAVEFAHVDTDPRDGHDISTERERLIKPSLGAWPHTQRDHLLRSWHAVPRSIRIRSARYRGLRRDQPGAW